MSGKVSRTQFERLLVHRLDTVQAGTAYKAKQRIGGAWRTIVDHLYNRNTGRLSANRVARVLDECTDAIVQLMKSIKPPEDETRREDHEKST